MANPASQCELSIHHVEVVVIVGLQLRFAMKRKYWLQYPRVTMNADVGAGFFSVETSIDKW